MKAQVVLSFLLTLLQSLCGFQGTSFSVFFNHLRSTNDEIVVGRYDEDIILPCSFENEPDVVIHWKNQDNYNVHSYYKGRDHLENQDPKFTNRTSLFYSKIQNGNASLYFRRLSLLDEGIYICYVGTAARQSTKKVVLKVGAFLTPAMKYEKRNTSSFLVCSVLSVYPRPHITWKADSAFVPGSITEETGYLGPFYVSSTLNITGSNSSYECVIKNPLLKQTWTGQWTQAGDLCKRQSEYVSLSCQGIRNFSLQNEDFIVTWSRMKSEISSILGCYMSSSQIPVINEPRFSWNKELQNQNDFSMTLTDLHLSDSGEYLCNISSRKYTLLTVHSLHIEPSQGKSSWIIPALVALGVWAVILTLIVNFRHRWRRYPVYGENRNIY
ncbi:PREDICTED: HERV-H LTR-associating protein 2 [Chinchilla lanigera]|uniref:HHLA2 member of B7 family n=1 Tax=Chinchilla lanigera TaxID=34839 RepID=A0A8C2W4X6_CHILA|nr:PREDICTED: HERV-H LTR-associating protein 2 [Chinchilla lanigera]XP_013370514.1 PREDICTED: HERV-H LTR-associating protein 2 [Chinchilla lanigera]